MATSDRPTDGRPPGEPEDPPPKTHPRLVALHEPTPEADGPPPEAEAEAELESLLVRYQGTPAQAPIAEALKALGSAAPGYLARLAAGDEGAFRPMETLGAFMDRVGKLPPVGWVAENLLPDDGIALTHGQPRSLKSFAVLDALVAISTGENVWGFEGLRVPEPRAVAYLCEEDAERRVCERLAWLLAGRGLRDLPDNFRLSVRRGVSLDAEPWQEWILREMKDHGTRVLALDPLRGLTVGADKGPSDLAPVVRYLRSVQADTECSLLWLVHHDTKPIAKGGDPRERAQRASGGGIFSVSDAPIHHDRLDTRSGRALVVPNNYKFSEDPPTLDLVFEHDAAPGQRASWCRFSATRTTEAVALEDATRSAVLAFVRENPGQSGKAIRDSVRGGASRIGAALDALEAAGIVCHEPGPNGAKLWRAL